MTIYWVRLRYHSTGYEMTYDEKSALAREVLIAATASYADVVDQGERET